MATHAPNVVVCFDRKVAGVTAPLQALDGQPPPVSRGDAAGDAVCASGDVPCLFLDFSTAPGVAGPAYGSPRGTGVAKVLQAATAHGYGRGVPMPCRVWGADTFVIHDDDACLDAAPDGGRRSSDARDAVSGSGGGGHDVHRSTAAAVSAILQAVRRVMMGATPDVERVSLGSPARHRSVGEVGVSLPIAGTRVRAFGLQRELDGDDNDELHDVSAALLWNIRGLR